MSCTEEYEYYFKRNPNAFLYVNEYPRFLNEPVFAHKIIPKAEQELREQRAGYRDGDRPVGPLADIGRLLAQATAEANQRFAAQYSVQPVPAQQPQQLSAATMAPHAAFMAPTMGIPVQNLTPVIGQPVYPSPV